MSKEKPSPKKITPKKSAPYKAPIPTDVWLSIELLIKMAYTYEKLCTSKSNQSFVNYISNFYVKDINPIVTKTLWNVQQCMEQYLNDYERFLEKFSKKELVDYLIETYQLFYTDDITEEAFKVRIMGLAATLGLQKHHLKKLTLVTKKSIKNSGGASLTAKKLLEEVMGEGFSVRTLDQVKSKNKKHIFEKMTRRSALEICLQKVFSFTSEEISSIMKNVPHDK